MGITRDPLSSGSVLGVQERSPVREWSGVSTPKKTKSCCSEGMTLGQLPKSQRLSLTPRPPDPSLDIISREGRPLAPHLEPESLPVAPSVGSWSWRSLSSETPGSPASGGT